jgi:hypothetical protein
MSHLVDVSFYFFSLFTMETRNLLEAAVSEASKKVLVYLQKRDYKAPSKHDRYYAHYVKQLHDAHEKLNTFISLQSKRCKTKSPASLPSKESMTEEHLSNPFISRPITPSLKLPQNLPEEKKFQRTSGGWLSTLRKFFGVE